MPSRRAEGHRDSTGDLPFAATTRMGSLFRLEGRAALTRSQLFFSPKLHAVGREAFSCSADNGALDRRLQSGEAERHNPSSANSKADANTKA